MLLYRSWIGLGREWKHGMQSNLRSVRRPLIRRFEKGWERTSCRPSRVRDLGADLLDNSTIGSAEARKAYSLIFQSTGFNVVATILTRTSLRPHIRRDEIFCLGKYSSPNYIMCKET